MSVVSHPPRVAYVVSGDLVRYADLLPSNQRRSSMVHSLSYHLDLLDLSGLDQDEKGVGTSASTQKAKLLASIGADASTGASTSIKRNRATVVVPHSATHQQLTSYHEASFVKQLAKGAHVHYLESSSKRRKPLRRSQSSSAASSESNSEASHASSDGSDSSPEFKLRSPSAVSALTRERGCKRPRPPDNRFGLQDDCPAFDGLDRHIALVAGASITAAELLATGQADIAIAWDGGRHHAKKDSASGFCYINDVVLAILSLRKPRKVTITTTVPRSARGAEEETIRKPTIKRIDKVLYLDLDLHWGDGVEEAFHTTPNVLTLSIHHYAPGFFPCYTASSDPDRFGPPGSLHSDTGTGCNAFNIPLGLGASDASLDRTMQSAVQPIVDAWDPEIVVVQCGVDGLAGDPMAVWNLSAAAYIRAIQRVLTWRKPTLLLGGGGYCSPNAARCWSLITALCLNRFNGEQHSKATPSKPPQHTPTPLTHRDDTNETQPIPQSDPIESTSDIISYNTPIPDHKFWPIYAPDYTLDVPAGDMIDQNHEAHFNAINNTLLAHIDRISTRKPHAK